MANEEGELKEKALHAFNRASKETGCKDVARERPDLYKTFGKLTNDLEELDDLIHELKAKVDMCMGTDQSVGGV